jgi:endonuclease
MRPAYRLWLERQKYQANTVNAQMHRAGRVEEYYGDLDDHYANDVMAGLIQALTYSMDDKRRGRPNPSKIPFDGDIYRNLASYRDAVNRYRKFRDDDGGAEVPIQGTPELATQPAASDEIGQRIGLERDLQAALRLEIGQLEEGLTIIDDGAERSVDSGFVDITARDTSGTTVVIELKAGKAGQQAVAQILSYMGDVAAEEGGNVRGILVASEFDARAKAAARMVPNLFLRRYSIRFLFSQGHT